MALQEFLHTRPGMIGNWVTRPVLVLRGGGIANKILLSKQHVVPLCGG